MESEIEGTTRKVSVTLVKEEFRYEEFRYFVEQLLVKHFSIGITLHCFGAPDDIRI